MTSATWHGSHGAATVLALMTAALCLTSVSSLTCYSCGVGLCSETFDASSTSQVISVGSSGCQLCYKAVDKTSKAISRYCVTNSQCPTIYNADVYCCSGRLCNSALRTGFSGASTQLFVGLLACSTLMLRLLT
ncbi:hypothetical protein BOX15_Mlig028776g2 [Macrostomum lignano]|uniref:Uncharacterized protein n=2 Tax=Macrostomum lignano TaxID=282301 RepID=A0A267EWS0_9PLAT|nr:hypothetical protein BOX15_Mlig028776g1 [Macrostomum lignano]PAA86525.1 hypothetical protein BOX15_Mlig028776g2 [Macrostomum lignano]